MLKWFQLWRMCISQLKKCKPTLLITIQKQKEAIIQFLLYSYSESKNCFSVLPRYGFYMSKNNDWMEII